MSPAAGEVAEGARFPAAVQHPPTEALAKDSVIAWFRGEFAAANAIIDALCRHLAELEGGAAEEYEPVFAAIHRRRLNWIPILQMQKYYSIADVASELKKVSKKKSQENDVKVASCTSTFNEHEKDDEKSLKSCVESKRNFPSESADDDGGGGDEAADDSPQSDITDSGSQEVHPFPAHVDICSNHEECEARRACIKMTKGFVGREPIKGRMVNVVRGLKLYEDIFTDVELSKLNDFVNDLRMAGQNGELSGDTFILYNQQMKGNKREMIQLGVPIFGQIKEDATGNIEPIPALLQGVIEHLIQWHLIPQNRKPNGCIINFFDEGEYSQPFTKPPHLDQPVSTLLLSESTMAFGRALFGNSEGNYKGPLILSLKEGSLLVMRGNSSEMARHAMCSSHNKRVSITFFRIQSPQIETESNLSEMSPLSGAITLWQPSLPAPYNYEPLNIIPTWGLLPSPRLEWGPFGPVAGSPRRTPQGGTGVFLPWTVSSRKPRKHLPPRVQRQQRLSPSFPIRQA